MRAEPSLDEEPDDERALTGSVVMCETTLGPNLGEWREAHVKFVGMNINDQQNDWSDD